MILHIDMDAFFASVEEREHPEFKGLPLVVGGSPNGRGVVSAANYAARIYGVHSAMPTARAIRLCPRLIIIKPQGKLYSKVSREIRNIFLRYTPLIEPLSMDEAFLDVDSSRKLYGSAENIGRRIKNEIRDELDLIASVGVAPNKFLAKLASDHDKPDGFTVIKPNQIQEFLDPLPISRLWGIGKASQAHLQKENISTVYDLRKTSEEFLVDKFGKTGKRLWQLSHGVDYRKVINEREAKSISREITFDSDITALTKLQSVAMELTESVSLRLRNAEMQCKTINIKVRYHDFSTVTRSKSLNVPSYNTLTIWQNVEDLLCALLGTRRFSVRLIGVGLSNLSVMNNTKNTNKQQSDLLEHFGIDIDQPEQVARAELLDQITDKIQQKFGKSIIRRGKSL